jgi:hypothetical protein
MALLAVESALLREVLLPGLTLSPGRTITARVAGADTGAGGRLAIAGYLLDAELPRELAAGDTVRLAVRDVTPQHVLLAVVHDQAAATPPLAPAEAALPGGAQLKVVEDERSGGRGSRQGHAVSLELEMPALGTIDLHFELDGSGVRATIAVAQGDALSRARDAAPTLREALAQATERPVTVTVTGRREPLDVYA